MMNERFQMARMRAARRELDDAFLPAWTAEALCRSDEIGGEGSQRPGMPWADAFDDDLATRPDPDLYEWPPRLQAMMEVCAGCPVRRLCLARAFEFEGFPILLEPNVPHYTPHHEGCAVPACAGCVPLEERIVIRDVTVEMIPSGVYGGVPGRVRSYFMDAPCPEHIEGSCQTCQNTGKVLRPDRVKLTQEWADTYAERMGWTVAPAAIAAVG